MINTAQDFETALVFCQEEQTPFNRKITNDMSSATFNNIFQELENDIDNLYEKIRVLEDIKNYTQTFVVRAIEERRKKIIDALKVIEHSVDNFQNQDFIAHEISFSQQLEHIVDRDGSAINCFEIKDGRLIIPSTNTNVKTLVAVTNLGQLQKLVDDYVFISDTELTQEDTIDTVEHKPIITIYESDQPVSGGLIVEYELTFSGRQFCNYFTMNPVNCEILEITATDSENQTYKLDPENEFLNESIDIIKVKVKAKCSDYNRKTEMTASTCGYSAFDQSIAGNEKAEVLS